MKKIIPILMISLLLVGCGFEELLPDQEPEVIVKEVIKEVIKEKIVYIDRNITTPHNTSCVNNITVIEANSSYVFGLIRQLKYCESQQVNDWNISECEYELNRCNSTLNSTMEKLRDILD